MSEIFFNTRIRKTGKDFWIYFEKVFPEAKEEMKHKFYFLGDMLEKMGVPLMDDSIYALVDEFFDKLPDEK